MATSTQWGQSSGEDRRREGTRASLMRRILYHASEARASADFPDDQFIEAREGEAVSINISSGGMLLLMDWNPDINSVMRVTVPTPVNLAKIPTLAEVRWKRKSPYFNETGLYFVGLRFIF